MQNADQQQRCGIFQPTPRNAVYDPTTVTLISSSSPPWPLSSRTVIMFNFDSGQAPSLGRATSQWLQEKLCDSLWFLAAVYLRLFVKAILVEADSSTPQSHPSPSLSEQYRYTPLPKGQIRLLRLLPHLNASSPIQCELFTHSLITTTTVAGTRPYETLSYVWGSPMKTRTIYINGRSFLSITENLHAAISRLRDSTLPHVVWIDAVCINQEDIREREGQVKLMARIYARSTRVVVWLDEVGVDKDGQDDEDREETVEAVSEGAADQEFVGDEVVDGTANPEAVEDEGPDAGTVGNEVGDNEATKDEPPRDEGALALKMLRELANGEAATIPQAGRRATAKLLKRSWFKRVWVRHTDLPPPECCWRTADERSDRYFKRWPLPDTLYSYVKMLSLTDTHSLSALRQLEQSSVKEIDLCWAVAP